MRSTEEVQRIVSLVPSTTESVADLGAGDRLVACTRYCVEPAALLRHVPRIGGTKNPDLEVIVAHAPDLVLANAEENRAEDIDWLASRVPVLVQTPRSVVEAAAELRVLAERLGMFAAARPFLQRIEAWLAVAAADSATRRARHVYYAIWPNPWMTVNRDTFVHDVLNQVGANNIAATEEVRYPELLPPVAVARGVELVLLASEPWPFDAAWRDRIAAERLFGDADVVLCDGRDFCWHGTRMAVGLGRALELMRRS